MTIAMLIVQALVTYGPEVAKQVQAILANNNPTQADWNALFDKALQKTYDQYTAPK